MTKTKARRYGPKKGKTTHRRLDSEEANKAYTRLNKPSGRKENIRSQGKNRKKLAPELREMLLNSGFDHTANEARLTIILQALKTEHNPTIKMSAMKDKNWLQFEYWNPNGQQIVAFWTGAGGVEDEVLQLYNFMRNKGAITFRRSNAAASILDNIRAICVKRRP